MARMSRGLNGQDAMNDMLIIGETKCDAVGTEHKQYQHLQKEMRGGLNGCRTNRTLMP